MPSHGRLDAILINAGISAGFPSPAGDFKQERISLDKELIKNKEATFFARVSGESFRRVNDKRWTRGWRFNCY